MRKLKILLIFVFVFGAAISVLEPQEVQDPQQAQQVDPNAEIKEPPALDQGMKVGSIRIPRPFIHADKEYEAGIYVFRLIEKEGNAYFDVFSPKLELLFQELAIVKPNKSGKKGSKFRVKKGFIDNYEYFRLDVLKPGEQLIAFFLVKK
jgi:hypothetical protein